MPEYRYATYELRDHIARITINRPEVMNAMHFEASGEVARMFDDFAADPDAWVAILTGAGDRAFCAGNDLKATAAGTNRPMTEFDRGFGGLTDRHDLFKPVIASVNGWAMGGGFELALACDIIVASRHAKFGLPEPRVGLYASAGGLHRLPRQIPQKIAMGLILTGRAIDADEAYRVGLVNEVVEHDDLAAATEEWAQQILLGAPLAVRGSKEVAVRTLDRPMRDAFRGEARGDYAWLNRQESSLDKVEGPRAFSEKRQPKWLGR
jgi:crotonobetainyl-CoA hydratase